jgi:hypothetical protein
MSRLLRQLSPFYRIGGTSLQSPNSLYRVQTHAFFDRSKGCQIAAILYGVDHRAIVQSQLQIKAKSQTEAAWASVALGLALAVQHKKPSIGIENDNLGIIRALIFHRNFRSRHEYAHHYFHEIMRLASNTEWTGVRWIPRSLNSAHDLCQ